MTKNTSPEDLQRQWNLQWEVLQYRDRLYTGIDGNRTAEEVGRVLDDLKQLGFLEIGSNGTVTSTPRGKVWLKGMESTD